MAAALALGLGLGGCGWKPLDVPADARGRITAVESTGSGTRRQVIVEIRGVRGRDGAPVYDRTQAKVRTQIYLRDPGGLRPGVLNDLAVGQQVEAWYVDKPSAGVPRRARSRLIVIDLPPGAT